MSGTHDHLLGDGVSGRTPTDGTDAACWSDLSAWIQRVLPALEAFARFAGPDDGGRNRAQWTAALDQPLPQDGAGMEAVVRELNQTVIPHGLRIGAPGFSGWVTTAPTVAGTVSGLAGMVAGAQRVWNHPCNLLETVALRWLADMLGLPPDRQGVFVGGGSVANVVGLAGARQWAFEQQGHDPARDGLPPDLPGRVYASSEVHHVVIRAAAVLGLGRRCVVEIPVDGQRRLRVDLLRRRLDQDTRAGLLPLALVATAGTVNTGAVDPIAALADLAREYRTWLHVDGAYGLFGILDPRVAPLYAGLDQADSVAVDPHKWLAAPIGCGAAFVRDRQLLGRAFTLEPAEYLEGSVIEGPLQSPFDNFGDSYLDFGPDQSAPSRGIQVWAILKEIGVRGVRDRIIRHHDFARRVAERALHEPRLELVTPPVLSICCFRYRPPHGDEARLNQLNQALAARLRAETPYVPSTTVIDGKLVLRPCFINPRTKWSDVDGLVDAVVAIGDRLAGR